MSDDQSVHNLSPEHLWTLYQITKSMNSSLDFDEVLNTVMDSVIHITNGQRGFVMSVNENTTDLHTLVIRGVDGATLDEEGYSTTIAKEVVKTQKPLLTNNAMFDTRFEAGKSIIMRGLRAIMCAPMVVKERLIGVIYVDTSMRSGSFSQADLDLLSAVAGLAGTAIENARLYKVAVEQGRMQKELQMAADIQQTLLPRRMPEVLGYEVSALWKAARETAGDFYDAFTLDKDRFGVVIADVSDKGAAAAMFMAVARTMVRSNARVGFSPMETIARTNDLILEDAESEMFVTIYHSYFERGGHSIHINAGHNPPLIYRAATHEIEFLPRGGRAVGWFPNNPLQEIQIDLDPGDIIVYYTDGITEAENPQKEPYGEDRLINILADNVKQSADHILKRIVHDVEVFCDGEPAFDDMTLVVVRYTGG